VIRPQNRDYVYFSLLCLLLFFSFNAYVGYLWSPPFYAHADTAHYQVIVDWFGGRELDDQVRHMLGLRPLGYPLILYFFSKVSDFGLLLFQIVAWFAGCFFFFRSIRLLGLSPRAAFLFAFLYVLSPSHLVTPFMFLAESLSFSLFSISIYYQLKFLTKKSSNYVVPIFLLSLATAIRPSMVYPLIFACIWNCYVCFSTSKSNVKIYLLLFALLPTLSQVFFMKKSFDFSGVSYVAYSNLDKVLVDSHASSTVGALDNRNRAQMLRSWEKKVWL
jgi:Predicted integral membrane protein